MLDAISLSVVVLLLGAAMAWMLTLLLRRFALNRAILDVPGHRSSHREATPRGGGLAIVAVSAMGFGAFAVYQLGLGITAAMTASLVLAGVGFVDDVRRASVRSRLSIQVLCAVAVVTACQPYAIAFWGWQPPTFVLGVLLVLWYVWSVNLYNFMDGINGLATVEWVSVIFGLLVLALFGGQANTLGPLWFWWLSMSGAGLGFLYWNFPRARIFLGDSGSVFMGAQIAGLSIWFGAEAPAYFWAAIILLGYFICDASVTLLRRLCRLENITQAHRSHAYQRLARHFNSHGAVTLAVLAVNILWLLPWAWTAASGILAGPAAALCAWLPLMLMVFVVGAGRSEAT